MLQKIQEALSRGDRDEVSKLVTHALEQGMEVKRILDDGLIAGMSIIGARFKNNEIFIPEVLISAKAMQAGTAVLEPHFLKHGIKPIGKVAIGTVKGDLHDIGKNIVSMMLKSSSFDIEDFGIDVPPDKFVNSVKKGGVDILAMSSLLTTSMGAMRDVINMLKNSGMRDKVKIIVGGAPITQAFADSIGADAYAKDAASAVDVARALLKK